MASNDIGRVTPIWRGIYSAERAYELNDIVLDAAGSVWWHVSEEITTGTAPAEGGTWAVVIDMRIFGADIQAAIEEAQAAVREAEEARAGVTADAERAETAAEKAETYARNASDSATDVGAYAQAAEEAKTAAQIAASGAQAARTGAVSAKNAAETAKAGAETAKSGAETARDAAVTAKNAAQTAQSGAETAQAGAEQALSDTRAAKTVALEEIADALGGALEDIEAKRAEEVGAAETAIEEKGAETLSTIPADYTELYDYSLLHVEEINDTLQSIIYNADGSVNRIEHRAIVGNGVVRTDAYTFTDGSVMEVRTLASGASLTLTTDYNTLETTVVYSAAE